MFLIRLFPSRIRKVQQNKEQTLNTTLQFEKKIIQSALFHKRSLIKKFGMKKLCYLPTLFSGHDNLPQYSHLQAVPSLSFPSVPPRHTTVSPVLGSLKKQYIGVITKAVVVVVGMVVVGIVVGMVVMPQLKSSPYIT